VILFGSLATGTCRDTSDVDLAVSGVPRSLYFPVLADLMALFGAPVDLVRMEEVPKSLRGRIVAEGEIL
jgi:predicted nucleotidyltransferase